MNEKIIGKTIYFLGIGGIGMSALARYFLQAGNRIYGYDLTPSDITAHLEQLGATIHYEEDVKFIPEHVDFVVYTPAVPKTHQEYVYFEEKNIPIYKRSAVLGMISSHLPTIGVAGTHGKTTTTSMITTILHDDHPLLAFIGGIAKNFNANVVIDDHAEMMVVEADEFDRSFLTLHPEVGVITSMDADHLDIYGAKEQLVQSFQLYATQVRGAVVVNEKIAAQIQHPHKVVYGLDSNCDYYATDIQLYPNTSDFNLHHGDEVYPVHLSVSGTYNVLNAVAAYAAVREFCCLKNMLMQSDLCVSRLAAFNGVKRRFDYRIERPDFVYIDDYAHHPEELRAFITAVKNIYVGKKVCGIFQPHLYTRTRDFAPQFAEVLSLLDTVILLDIYPARELPIPGITSQYLLDMIQCAHKYLLTTDEVIPFIEQHRPEVLLTMGAGNIDRLVPKIEGAFALR
jgi:UDP-N-acetylmuramate--alanine ligase